MTIILMVVVPLMALFALWLLSQTLRIRPWVAQSAHTGHAPDWPAAATAPRVGLAVFLAVAASLFALTVSAYLMRMEHGNDWQPVTKPLLLWINTGVLVLGSLFLQRAWDAARHDRREAMARALTAGGAATVAFVVGQALVWRQLHAAGYYLAANPAHAFFVLLTALHALHLLGGMVAWGGTMHRVWHGAAPARVRGRVELCAVYWHFLLLVWAVLFALLLST